MPAVHFNCPNCNAIYRIIKAEAGPETVDREIACRACGGPLSGREGNFVLKYFFLRKAPPLMLAGKITVDDIEAAKTAKKGKR